MTKNRWQFVYYFENFYDESLMAICFQLNGRLREFCRLSVLSVTDERLLVIDECLFKVGCFDF